MSEEYEVESITQARVARKSKKLVWEYDVKWKGYSTDDNTWEPIASFKGSEDIVSDFWSRIDLNGRDYKNMAQFKKGDSFMALGPLRRKPSQRTLKSDSDFSSPSPAGASKPTREKKRRHSSPPADEIAEEPPSKRTRARAADPCPVDEPRTVPRTHKATPTRPPLKNPNTSSTRSLRRTKKRTPSPKFVPDSEEEQDDTSMAVDASQQQSITQPSEDAVPPSLEDAAPPESSKGKARAKEKAPSKEEKADSLPSHRARFANPLVKMVDDFVPLDNAIAAKSRVQSRNEPATETSEASSSSSPPRKPARKPGPGRSSAGFMKKNTSSLLTFKKGELQTVPGRFRAPSNERDRDPEPSASNVVPVVLPTSDELLELGGFDSTTAEALDDFQEEETPLTPAESTNANNTANLERLTLAKNSLFPPGASVATSFSNTITSIWRRTTIFGPLGLGSDTAAPPAVSQSKIFSLKLDTLVTVPLSLIDAHQSLDTIICETPNGQLAAGKFFTHPNALKLLETVRTSGPCARADLSESATEEQKAHFARFRSRLDQGELFTAMVGTVFVAFCSQETITMRLNLPPALATLSNGLFVAELAIENLTAYLEVAETADTSRWQL